MATIRLGRYEIEEEGLPAVCMRCGNPASVAKNKKFSWHPQWIDILIIVGVLCAWPAFVVGVILAGTMAKRLRVVAPLCADHKNHWLWRTWYILGGFGVFLVLGIGTLVFLMSTSKEEDETRAFAGWLCGGTAAAGFIWLISAAVIQNGAIRATEITDHSITLNKLSKHFVEAVRQVRASEGRQDEDLRPGPRREEADAETFFDPERPPRPPSP